MDFAYYMARGFHKIFPLNAVKKSNLDNTVKLCYDDQIVCCSVGRYTYIGEHSCILYADIGKFCSIADRCVIGGPAHSVDFVSTSPVFNKGRNIFGINFANFSFDDYKRTTIGNDVWIGSGCFIKSGVSISDGAVIGMGSVVTKDIGPYEIWAGNPAKFIRKRFDDETIRHLQKIQWWDFPEEKLHCVGKYFDSPDLFINKMKKDDDL